MDYSGILTVSHRKISTHKIKYELLEKREAKCAYCGISVPFGQLTLDAYLPYRTHPEAHKSENYVLACATCNHIKGSNEPIDEDGKVLILNPYEDDYWNEIKINELGIAEGLTDAGVSTISLLSLNRPELVSYRKDHIADYIGKINDGNSAFEVYQCSIRQIKELLQNEIANPELRQYFYQMIYSNVITAMEAYLSKNIISLVLNDENIFWKFVSKFDWNNEKVDISKIKDTYDSMNIKVQRKLTEILYHNLPKVRAMYQKILNINILQTEDDMRFFNSSVNIRHDLVHRNGRKGTNSRADEFHNITLDMINELITRVDSLINEVEEQKIQI